MGLGSFSFSSRIVDSKSVRGDSVDAHEAKGSGPCIVSGELKSKGHTDPTMRYLERSSIGESAISSGGCQQVNQTCLCSRMLLWVSRREQTLFCHHGLTYQPQRPVDRDLERSSIIRLYEAPELLIHSERAA